jgi:hypothetical protein
MSDIVTRLRNWREVHLARLHLLMDEAADEMERLSANGDCPDADNAANGDKPCPYVTGKTTKYCTLTPFTLTDVERAAIERAMKDENDFGMVYTADVLKWLLERLSP